MNRTEFKALEAAEGEAFKAWLRCDCKRRLTKKGCQHAQATHTARERWYAAHKEMGLVSPGEILAGR